MKGGLLVISGPSGVGKDTIIDALPSRIPAPCHRVRTLTTRTPSHGRDPSYEFADLQGLQTRMRAGRWIANEQASGSYATNIDEIDIMIARGFVCIHSVFPSSESVGRLREIFAENMLSIAIMPPGRTDDEMESHIRSRLEHRARPGDDVRRRIQMARSIIAYVLSRPVAEHGAKLFDDVVVNDSLDDCIDEIASIAARTFL